MKVARLVPGNFYWARSTKHVDAAATVVEVSTIFGEEPEYWTLITLGSDQHHMPSDFQIIARVEAPEEYAVRLAAE